MKKTLTAMVAILLAAACSSETSLEGKWLQPVPGMENMEQGFLLAPDGRAESVNMSTLRYKRWQRDGNKLILSGESIGNGQTIVFEEEYEIEKLDDSHLVLRQNDGKQEFRRPAGNLEGF